MRGGRIWRNRVLITTVTETVLKPAQKSQAMETQNIAAKKIKNTLKITHLIWQTYSNEVNKEALENAATLIMNISFIAATISYSTNFKLNNIEAQH